ncbi:MAG: DMT family transporter [Nitrospira sp.]|nr:DMT family transporter [Nitrospira sp.]
MPPLLLAGLLYLGSGLGLGALLLLRRVRAAGASLRARAADTPLRARAADTPLRGGADTPLRGGADAPLHGGADAPLRVPRGDLPWLFGATVFGGMLGPVLLLAGLARSDAASASLLLNLEVVLTALLAWWVFHENADRRIVFGVLAIVAGGVLLSIEPGGSHPGSASAGAAWSAGALLIAGACLCWAIDNNLTRKVSAHDAMVVACAKGLVAGACNTALALGGGAAMPAAGALAAALAVGFLGYGLSLTLFVLGLRTLGTARTGAYFSVAPLFGLLLALLLWPRWPSAWFWVAAALMALGLWLHVSERHAHSHTHEALEHMHRHRHDEHHRHAHDFAWDGVEPHVHPHRHEVLTHSHAHHPDIHHRHRHGKA